MITIGSPDIEEIQRLFRPHNEFYLTMGPRNVVSKNKKKMKSRKFFMSMCIQTHQEIIYQEYQATKHREKSSQLQQYYEQIVSKTQTELTIAKKDLDGMKKKHGELAERLSERSRQYQKLQSLYESLRRRCITPASFNGGGDASMIDQTASRLQNFTMNLTTGDVLRGQNSSNQGSRGQSPPERDFVFRPNNTPLLAEQSRFSLMLGTPK